jgi:hydrogenase maturation protein HypF
MLPYSPLHLLLLADWDRPLVMTSGNLSDEPQCIDNAEAMAARRLADAWLVHDRAIVNRVDDSVARVVDAVPRLLRRARGYAPAPLPLPPGLEQAPPLMLALGAELKNTICLVSMGRRSCRSTWGIWRRRAPPAPSRRRWPIPTALRAGAAGHRRGSHPDYRSTQRGRAWAAEAGIAVVEVQHHLPISPPCSPTTIGRWRPGRWSGWPFDGLGYGTDGRVWGGELLVATIVSGVGSAICASSACPAGAGDP